MKRPLQPRERKPVSFICERLKAAGYDPFAMRGGKDKPPKGWKTIQAAPSDYGRSAAIRTQNTSGLVVLDFDIGRTDLLDAALARCCELVPSLKNAPRRHSGKASCALFVQMVDDTERKNPKSSRWGKSADYPKGHLLEIFTWKSTHYFLVWGEHSPGREYGWTGAPLWEVPFEDLPLIKDADIPLLLDAVDAVMRAHGMEMVERALVSGVEHEVFDLKLDDMWRMEDGEFYTLAQFIAMFDDGAWHAGYANLWDEKSTTATRVKAKVTFGGLTLWDSKTHTNHHLAQVEVLTPEGAAAWRQVIADNPERPFFTPAGGAMINQFWAYGPTHQYIDETNGEMWVVAGINGLLPHVPTATGFIKPSAWLDRNKPVHQMLWAPGEPTLVRDRMMSNGGWIDAPGRAAFNTYRAPPRIEGDPQKAKPWLDLIEKLYPDDMAHIVGWCAHAVQHVGVKINHALVLVGPPRIGKDTIVEPLRHGVGEYNFHEVSPHDVMDKWNDYMCNAVVRVSEARDLGDIKRWSLYEKMKTMLAAPPETLRIDAKYKPQFHALNAANFVITTNHQFDGLYLPADDGRHYVAGTNTTRNQVIGGDENFFRDYYRWYLNSGRNHIVAFLHAYDLDAAGFDAKSPPPKTEAFYRMVSTNVAPEVAWLKDVITRLGNPAAITPQQLRSNTGENRDLRQWLEEPKYRRVLPLRLEECGYVPIRNLDASDGYWAIKGVRHPIYARVDMPSLAQAEAARGLIKGITEAAQVLPFTIETDATRKKSKKKPPEGE